MVATVAEVLSKDRVEFDELEQRYSPVLNLVDVLIGVVPNCDRYLEIWRPGFRTYNLTVPNFLNLPQSLLGLGAPKDVVGLGMYASSRAAHCMYCSAHTCSFALRRGSSTGAVTGEARTAGESAAVAVAEALSTMPHGYTPELGAELRNHFPGDDAEWIVMGVAMMGFLNKFMDAIGVELEPEAIGDVADLIEPTGWSIGQHGWSDESAGPAGGAAVVGDAARRGGLPPVDSARTMLTVLRNVPGAIRLERRWMAGLPKGPDAERRHIAREYGFDQPLLTTIGLARPRRALTAILRHNLDPDQSELGIGLKALVGLVFAHHAGNRLLIDRLEELAAHHGVDRTAIDTAATVDPAAPTDHGFDDRTRAALAVAHRFAPSPAVVDEATVAASEQHLSTAELVEIAVWVSVCQLMHRLGVYYDL